MERINTTTESRSELTAIRNKRRRQLFTALGLGAVTAGALFAAHTLIPALTARQPQAPAVPPEPQPEPLSNAMQEIFAPNYTGRAVIDTSTPLGVASFNARIGRLSAAERTQLGLSTNMTAEEIQQWAAANQTNPEIAVVTGNEPLSVIAPYTPPAPVAGAIDIRNWGSLSQSDRITLLRTSLPQSPERIVLMRSLGLHGNINVDSIQSTLQSQFQGQAQGAFSANITEAQLEAWLQSNLTGR